MRFYPPDAPVPAELRTAEFLLRMLRATDVELDYDAVIKSRELLLVRSGGAWPKEGFSLADNLADLQKHEADYLARTSFTYTVMNPTETRCLGCVYINPLLPLLQRLQASETEISQIGDDEAWVTFWVRQSRLADELDKRLFAALRGWFTDAWAFKRVLFRANDNEARVMRLYQAAGLQPRYTLQAGARTTYLYE
jgi:hypothetical protein